MVDYKSSARSLQVQFLNEQLPLVKCNDMVVLVTAVVSFYLSQTKFSHPVVWIL